MSVHAALEAALPPGSLTSRRMDTSVICDFRDFDALDATVRNLMAVTDDDIRSMRQSAAISGHFSLTTLLSLTSPQAIGTILREPRARTLSLYLYWRTPTIFDAVRPYRAHEHALLPLDRFLNEPRVAPAVDNQICRMLLYGDPRMPTDGFIAPSDINAVASDAIAQLDTLGSVGVLELGDSAWRGLDQLFDVHLEPGRMNVTGELKNPVPLRVGEEVRASAILDLIEQRNAADKIVYDHALGLAGIRADARQRLARSAFADQLVRLGDLLGDSTVKPRHTVGT